MLLGERARRTSGAAATTLAGVGLAELGLASRGRSLLDSLGRPAVDHTPVPLVELGIRLVGTADKPMLRAGATAALTGVGAAVGVAVRARPMPPALSVSLACAGAGALVAARRSLARRHPATRPGLAAGAGSGPALRDGAEAWPGVAPLTTPVGAFYQTDVAMRPPVVDVDAWRLRIEDGTGAHVEVDATQLAGLPLREREALLACVHNRPGWDRLGQQRWVGLPLTELLDHVGLQVPEPDAPLDLVMEAVDGLTMILPWRQVVEWRTWLVTGMGGRPLPKAHGHPARVMTPGLVGQYNGVKWVQTLRLVPADTLTASWVARGWPREPVPVPPMARIDSPGMVGMPPRLPRRPVAVGRHLAATGTAWAPANGGVAAVEVSLDGGPWRRANLADDLGSDCWRRWRLDLDLDLGDHELAVRCVAADGTIQGGTGRPPFPRGADGHHRVRVVARGR